MNNVGREIYELVEELYPICRSITGDGVRQSLAILQRHIPVKISQIPSGTQVYDWTIPKEWNIRDAYIKNSKGEKIIDFKRSNLHVLNYSVPVNKKLSLDDLKKNLFTLPEYPSWIPYRTSYYADNWGFCLSHEQYEQLKDETYEVVIDSKKEDGFLTYGEMSLRGRMEDEVLFTCYLCHPSLCNDNLSGVALVAFLAKYLKEMELEEEVPSVSSRMKRSGCEIEFEQDTLFGQKRSQEDLETPTFLRKKRHLRGTALYSNEE